jgi:hypothetical protein
VDHPCLVRNPANSPFNILFQDPEMRPGNVTLPIDKHKSIVIRVIEDQITTLRPYNARYTGDHRSFFRSDMWR